MRCKIDIAQDKLARDLKYYNKEKNKQKIEIDKATSESENEGELVSLDFQAFQYTPHQTPSMFQTTYIVEDKIFSEEDYATLGVDIIIPIGCGKGTCKHCGYYFDVLPRITIANNMQCDACEDCGHWFYSLNEKERVQAMGLALIPTCEECGTTDNVHDAICVECNTK